MVGLEEDCPLVEESAPSDSVGPTIEELVSMYDKEGAGSKEGVTVEDKETEQSKGLTRSKAAEEDEEEEEPDVYYFESDHLALKHNKEYVGVC